MESEVKDKDQDNSRSSCQDLVSHIKDIKQSFETFYSSEMAWLKPLPWITDFEFEPEEFYVELQMEELSRGGKLSKKESTKVEDLLKPEPGYTKTPKRILVRGEAGFGKTTMCLKIAYDWSTGKEGNLAESFELLLLFRLRDLLQNESPEESLLKFCHDNATKNVEESYTVDALREMSDKVLIFLDGYDELSTCHADLLRDLLVAKKGGSQPLFRNSTIVVTSSVTEDEQFFKLFQRHVRIVGLSEESQAQLVKNMFMDDEERAVSILNMIKNYGDSFSSSVTPLILLLICYLYQMEGNQINRTPTRSMVLHGVLLLMGRKCCERLGSEKTLDQIKCLYRRLGQLYLSREGSQPSLLFSRTEVKQWYPIDDDSNFILQCGLLRSTSSLSKCRLSKDTLEPVHKIFLDFVCARHLQYNFESISGIDDKLSFMLSNLKPEIFSLVSDSSKIVFYTEGSRFKGMEFLCMWDSEVEDVEEQLSSGAFVVSDDEVYVRLLKAFKAMANACGDIGLIFERLATRTSDDKECARNKSSFRGLGKFFPPFVKGRNLLIAVMETATIGDCVLMSLVDSEYEKDTEFDHNLKFKAEDNGNYLWSCEMCIDQVKCYPEQWAKEEDEGFSIFETYCESIENKSKSNETDSNMEERRNSISSNGQGASNAGALNLESELLNSEFAASNEPSVSDATDSDKPSSKSGKASTLKKIIPFKIPKFNCFK